MKTKKPKLLPTLICFAIVGLWAIVLPYPKFDVLPLMGNTASESAFSSK
ncbi:MAG: hypothetical protein KME45_05585 [Stenomitos rutilans HA7619-LM2]|nr:hypothetical protein [Stenomitos rutilans HA7619-LM2]